ncbi:metal ABC transporter substrate-binding protein [Paenibacillus nasutitermitis]|uniref:Zinc ABC transporter substrate-binding protein n=1 Tax=Paenibacillus nasutitermitis TaxID=1652958 RepID=A0A916YYF2_9BACL|nr:metal ABC transporter substrate-binding protein [Paenibacillus nasutitermitis]GGD66943.1 zinc ABC transporter substrate-binding protein [Paenibacillus nasutitermitis]
MRFRMSKWLALTAVTALLLTGCGSISNEAENSLKNDSAVSGEKAANGANIEEAGSGNKLKIVATFYPMAEFSRQVAGSHAEVIGLIPSGTEPHDWEPSAKDMVQIQEADVFVYNGLVEEWVQDALDSAGSQQRIVVEASSGIELMESMIVEEEGEGGRDEDHDHNHAHEDGHVLDPHVWLSPVLAQQEVAAIQRALVQADPAHEADYKKNAEAYIARLQDLDEAFRKGLENPKRKEFVTQHAAFGYLAKEYGLTQIPIAGLSPDEEPSPEKMAGVVEFAKKNQMKTIFFETLVEPKVAQTIADEIGAKTDVLNPLEGLTEEETAQEMDYIAVMNKNLEALKKALHE